MCGDSRRTPEARRSHLVHQAPHLPYFTLQPAFAFPCKLSMGPPGKWFLAGENALSCFLSAALAQLLCLSSVSCQGYVPWLESSSINPRTAFNFHYAHRRGHLGKMKLPDHCEVKELAKVTQHESAETNIRAGL